MNLTTRFIISCSLISLIFNASAQSSSLAEQRYVKLQQEAETQDKLILDIAADLKRLDTKIEAEIVGILKLITKYKDSQDSRGRILRNKERLIGGLQKSIEYYGEHRQLVTKEILGTQRFLVEDLKKFGAYLDKKITLRVKQILEITQSLEKYKEFTGDNYSNSDKTNVRRADREKNDLIEDFEKARKELEKQQDKLQQAYDNPTGKVHHSVLSDELSAVYAKIELINYSIEDLLDASDKTKKISGDSAKIVEKQLRSRGSAAKSYFTTYSRGMDNLLRQLRKRKTQQDSIDRHIKLNGTK